MAKPKSKRSKQSLNCDLSEVSFLNFHDEDFNLNSVSYVEEILMMQHSFGDNQKPLIETAEILESIVHEQMCRLILLAKSSSLKRGSNVIDFEDFLFLLLKSKDKLHCLISKIFLKGVKTAVKEENFEKIESFSEKNINSCKKFLEKIDCLEDFGDIFENLYESKIMNERNKSAYDYSKNMDEINYNHFCKCRQASFSKAPQKFQSWFACLIEQHNLEITAFAWEILIHLSYETLYELVTYSLIVKNEQSSASNVQVINSEDGFSSNIDGFKVSEDRSLRSDKTSKDPLTVDHILETFRRISMSLDKKIYYDVKETKMNLSGMNSYVPIICLQ